MTEILFARLDDVDASAANAASEAAALSAAAAAQSAQQAADVVADIAADVAAAEAAAAAAAISETNAATSASTASSAATSATGSASAAAGSATAASGSASAAATSASAASTSATNAGNSATAAAGSASTASTAATNAGNSATAAAGSASTASTAATNAGNSATAAAGSASAAATSATNAGNSATAAAGSAADALDSANDAAAIAATIGSLDSLTDVVITSPTNGQALIYDSSLSIWKNGAGGGGGTGTVTSVDITAPAAGITASGGPVTTSGAITLALANDLAAVEGLSGTGFSARTAVDTWAIRSLVAPAAGFTITNPAGVAGNPTFALSDDLAGLEGVGTTGILVRTGTNTYATRVLSAPASGFSINQSGGIGSNPTFILNDDLAAVEGLAATGIVRRTGTSVWSAGTAVANSELATMPTMTFKANLSGGTAVPTDTTLAQVQTALGTRERLLADRTYYVRTDGSDSNNGLTNTSGGAFLTIAWAYAVVLTLDLGGFNVTIKVADGTYTGANQFNVAPLGGILTIEGNTTTPANCIISTTNAHCFFVAFAGNMVIKGFKVQSVTSGCGILASNSARVDVSNMDFGTCASAHIQAQFYSNISIQTNYTISGGATRHFNITGSGFCTSSNLTVTLTGTPAFTIFAYCDRQSFHSSAGMTFSGSATGQRYNVQTNGIILTGGTATYFPGNTSGTNATQGQYL